MPRGFCLIFLCLGLFPFSSRADDAAQAATPVAVEIINQAGEKLTLSLAELQQFPQQSLKVKEPDGKETTYSGPPLAAVPKKAKVVQGKELRGTAVTRYLIVEARDKYRVVFSLPEPDPDWTENVVLLAIAQNGKSLDSKHGPFQIALSSEKRRSRWVRQVSRLLIGTAPSAR